jgi:hypothetical protein
LLIKSVDIYLQKTSRFFIISSFYPSGELTFAQRLRFRPFAAVNYSFMSEFLVAAAISAREQFSSYLTFYKEGDS